MPLESIHLKQQKPDGTNVTLMKDEPIILQKGKPGGFSCIAFINGSMDEPNVKILVDGIDETTNFQRSLTIGAEDPNAGLGLKNSTLELHYFKPQDNPEVVNPQFDITDYNGKTLTCEGYRTGFDTLKVSAEVQVQCKYNT